MSVQKYRKKPVVIEAIQFTGENQQECIGFCNEDVWEATGGLIIPTLEGNHLCAVGDFIIKGIHGEFYPCKPDIFAKTYEAVQ